MPRTVTVAAEVYRYLIDLLDGDRPRGVPDAAQFLAGYLDPIRQALAETFDELTETPGHPNRRHYSSPVGWGVVHLICEQDQEGEVSVIRAAVQFASPS